MQQRRLERLKQVAFFMTSQHVPGNARRVLALGACHNLLTGWFQNSHWATAWYCIKQAAQHSWMEFSVIAHLWWYRRILRLTEEEINEKL